MRASLYIIFSLFLVQNVYGNKRCHLDLKKLLSTGSQINGALKGKGASDHYLDPVEISQIIKELRTDKFLNNFIEYHRVHKLHKRSLLESYLAYRILVNKGIPSENIRLIWAQGKMKISDHGQPYSVSLLVRGNFGTWQTLDSRFGVSIGEGEWVIRMNEFTVSKPLNFFITGAFETPNSIKMYPIERADRKILYKMIREY